MAVAPWRVELGDRVRQCREERHWSLRTVAAKSGVPDRTWRRVEHGDSVVSDWTLIQVADCLGWPRGECFRIIANHLDDEEERGN